MLSPDSQAILAFCSHLGLEKDTGLTPLTLREWNLLAYKIKEASFERPENLIGQTAAGIKAELDIPEEEAVRLVRLLERIDLLKEEVKRLTGKGIYVITRADPEYPPRYRQRLRESAPMVLFYAGEFALLGQPGIAVVGSRHLDQVGQECASFIGSACGFSGLVLYSGGAKGVDTIGMEAALESRGSAVGILADSLETAVRSSRYKGALVSGNLCLVTPYAPSAGFSVGAAMGRNRLIYCLADYAVVVASDAEKGGTWAGATEALKAGWLPVFVLDHPAAPDGNRLLMNKGAIAFPHPFPEHYRRLRGWLEENSHSANSNPTQLNFL